MNNSISNNVNFNGAFIVNYPKTIPGLREGLEKNLGNHGKAIFENFNGNEKSVLYVVRNSKDYNIANFIKKNLLKFAYIPELDTKMLHSLGESLKSITTYITESKPEIINKTSELIKFVNENRESIKAVKPEPKTSLYQKIIKNLGINVQGNSGKNNRGVFTIKDKENDGLLSISPQTKFGISYVYVKPSNSYDPVRRAAVDKEGNVVAEFKTPDGINKFKEKFKQAAKDFLDSQN